MTEDVDEAAWRNAQAIVTNANSHAINVDLTVGEQATWELRRVLGRIRTTNGSQIMTFRVPAGATRTFKWQFREVAQVETQEE